MDSSLFTIPIHSHKARQIFVEIGFHISLIVFVNWQQILIVSTFLNVIQFIHGIVVTASPTIGLWKE